MSKKRLTKIKRPKAERLLIYGLAQSTFLKFKQSFGINKRLVLKKLKKYRIVRRRFNNFFFYLKKLTGRKLRAKTKKSIYFLKRIRNYKYFRHRLKLPVRGQRTRTNAKTQKKYRRI